MKFMRILFLALLGTLAYIGLGNSSTVEVPMASNFELDGKLSAEKQVPIMVLFSAESCAYCEALKSDQLRPMMISGEYDNKVIMRELHIDSFKDVIYFDGEAVSAESLASKYNIWVTPTLMFFDSKGNTLAHKIVGYNTPDMFGGYLDEQIDSSIDMLRTKMAQR